MIVSMKSKISYSWSWHIQPQTITSSATLYSSVVYLRFIASPFLVQTVIYPFMLKMLNLLTWKKEPVSRNQGMHVNILELFLLMIGEIYDPPCSCWYSSLDTDSWYISWPNIISGSSDRLSTILLPYFCSSCYFPSTNWEISRNSAFYYSNISHR